MTRTRIVAALLTATLVPLGVAWLPSADGADPAPLTSCTQLEQMDCTTVVMNMRLGDEFCQKVGSADMRCEAYWPFRNPSIYPHRAAGDPEAFPSDYLAMRRAAYSGEQKVARKQARIERMQVRIESLRERLHSM